LADIYEKLARGDVHVSDANRLWMSEGDVASWELGKFSSRSYVWPTVGTLHLIIANRGGIAKAQLMALLAKASFFAEATKNEPPGILRPRFAAAKDGLPSVASHAA
jgi:hypothetical protein